MEKRIKCVWMLSLAAMALLIASQGYWLMRQYEYNSSERINRLMRDCDDALAEELRLRTALPDSLAEASGLPNIFCATNEGNDMQVIFDSNPGTDGEVLQGQPSKTLAGVTSWEYGEVVARYDAARKRPFQPEEFRRLLKLRCECEVTDIVVEKDTALAIRPTYSIGGTLRKSVEMCCSLNPIGGDAMRCTIVLPASPVILSMWRQWLVELLLLAALAFCLIFQIRTILHQRRIDRIRHQFLRDMMYEQRQPQEPAAPGDTLRIGGTEFVHSLNELRCGNQRTIITARQADILRMLAENAGETVARDRILLDVWGDDSPANSMALNVQITYLRRALRPDPTLAIVSVIRKGYKLQTGEE